MTRRTTHRRGGFTLIELLVVIGIIVLLMGLLLPAVMRVLGVGPKADNTSRITTIGQTISTFGSEQRYGQVGYIPAGEVDIRPMLPTNPPTQNPDFGKALRPFRLRNSYTATTNPPDTSFEAQYIARVFGSRVNLANLGNAALPGNDNTPPILLDGNQCLTFFLGGIPQVTGQDVVFTGFSMNPQQPFAPKLQTDENRKGPLLELNSKRYKLGANGFPRLTDAYGNPFAYFSAYEKKPGKMSGYNATLNTEPGLRLGLVQPYGTGGKFENDTSFQIISAGKDGQFGGSGNWSAVGPTGQDDQANFTKDLLGAGPQ